MTAEGRRAWLVAGLWAAFLLLLTSLPGQALPAVGVGFDKVAHLGLYGVLGALVSRALLVDGWARGGWLAVLAALLALAGLDELHQALVPGRSTEMLDWIADAAGAVTGMATGRLLGRVWAKAWLR